MYQLDPDYGGKLRVSAGALVPPSGQGHHALSIQDNPHLEQKRGAVVRPSLYRAMQHSPEQQSNARVEVEPHRTLVVHGPPPVVGMDTTSVDLPYASSYKKAHGVVSLVTGMVAKTVVGAVKLAAVGAAVWVGVSGAGHAARWVGQHRPGRSGRRTRAASAGLEGQQVGWLARDRRGQDEEPASRAMQWFLEHGTPERRAPAPRRLPTRLPRMQEEGWLHWPHALEVSPCFEEAMQRPRVPVCPPPQLGTARG